MKFCSMLESVAKKLCSRLKRGMNNDGMRCHVEDGHLLLNCNQHDILLVHLLIVQNFLMWLYMWNHLVHLMYVTLFQRWRNYDLRRMGCKDCFGQMSHQQNCTSMSSFLLRGVVDLGCPIQSNVLESIKKKQNSISIFNYTNQRITNKSYQLVQAVFRSKMRIINAVLIAKSNIFYKETKQI